MVTRLKHQSDHDLTELSWLTQSDIFDQTSRSGKVSTNQTLTINLDDKHRHYSSPIHFLETSDSEHDNDSSSLNSSCERVTSTTDSISPPHSALCFWILFAIEDSKTRALTLNQICEWIEHYIEQSISSIDDHSIQSARLKSKIRYHMTKQISFFVKITKNPLNGRKLRYPLWTTDRSKRLLLLDTLLTMNTRQLSLTNSYTIHLFEHLCSERKRDLLRQMNDENSCPLKRQLNTNDDILSSKKKKKPSIEVVDAALTLLLLRQTK